MHIVSGKTIIFQIHNICLIFTQHVNEWICKNILLPFNYVKMLKILFIQLKAFFEIIPPLMDLRSCADIENSFYAECVMKKYIYGVGSIHLRVHEVKLACCIFCYFLNAHATLETNKIPYFNL